MQLTEIKTIRFSKEDLELMEKLSDMKFNVGEFIRITFREKANELIKTKIPF